MKRIAARAVLSLVALMVCGLSTQAAGWTADMKQGNPQLKSMGPLAFGPDGILFVADTKSAAIVAVAYGVQKTSTA
jgi:hypothetical protein